DRGRRPRRPRRPDRRNSAAPRARLRPLGQRNFSVRLRFPAASFAVIRTVRTGPWRYENPPAFTVRTTRFPLTNSVIVAGSLTQKRSEWNASARRVGLFVSTRKSAVRVADPT